MGKKIKFKLNKEGRSVTRCPNGLRSMRGVPRMAGDLGCMMCRFRGVVDWEDHTVVCGLERKRTKKGGKE